MRFRSGSKCGWWGLLTFLAKTKDIGSNQIVSWTPHNLGFCYRQRQETTHDNNCICTLFDCSEKNIRTLGTLHFTVWSFLMIYRCLMHMVCENSMWQIFPC